MATREGVGFSISGSRPVSQGKTEPGKEQSPSRLSRVQSYDSSEIFKIQDILSVHQKGVLSAL